MVVVGGEYVNIIEIVMKTVEEIGDVLDRIPEVVFVFLNNNDRPEKENLFSSQLDRIITTPTMVYYSN